MRDRFALTGASVRVWPSCCAVTLALLSTAAGAGTQAQQTDPTTRPAAGKARADNHGKAGDGRKTPAGDASKRMFTDVPRDNPAYDGVAELQREGLLANYPEGYFLGRRPLTYYELAVAVQRVVRQMFVRTLAPDGKTLQSTFGIPAALTHAQAQQILNLCNAFRPELEFLSDKREQVTSEQLAVAIRTLEAYARYASPAPQNANPVSAPPEAADAGGKQP